LEIEEFFDEECAHDVRRVIFDPFLREPELMAEASGSSRHRGASAAGRLYPVVERAVRRKYDVNPEAVARSREVIEAAIDRIERERGPSGYLVGDAFSVADLTAAAILAVLVRPPEFPYHQVDPARDPEDLKSWRDTLADRAGFKYVLEMYARHRGTSAEVQAA
jgi:glutathione S-transferase